MIQQQQQQQQQHHQHQHQQQQQQQQKTPLYFCGKKSIQINNSSLIQEIKEKIKQLGSFHLSSKYYTFLSKKNVNNQRKFFFSITSIFW